jgi:biopolymer transport protein ExbB/TolQ
LEFGRGGWNLRAIARTAPLLGALGTLVLVMGALTGYDPVKIAACDDCAGAPQDALVPFALSLPVAIFATAGWRYIRHEVDAFELEMRLATIDLLAALDRLR